MGSRVLLADDSVTIQKVVGIIFANEGYELTVVASGDAAVAKAREIKPDVMLIDALMPGKNGYEVCREVRQDPALAHTAILLMTGTFEAVDEERNRQSGADDFITKPFESQALIDATNRLIALTAERAAAPKAAVAAPAPAVEAAPVVPAAAPQVDDIWATGFDDEPAVAAPAEEADVFAMAPEAPAPVKASTDDDLWGAFDMDSAAEAPVAASAAAVSTDSAMSDDIFSFDSTAPVSAAEDEFILEEVVIDEPAAAPFFAAPPTSTGFEPVNEQEIAFGDLATPPPSQVSAPAVPVEDDFSTISFDEEPTAPAAAPVAPLAPAPAAEDFSTISFTEEPPAPVVPPVQPVIAPVVETVAPVAAPPVPPAVPPAAPSVAMGDAEIKAIIAGLSREVIERIVWEVVPDLAEMLIKEEIRKLKAGIA